jgi:DNA polymerase-3 subunit beta
MKFIARVNPKYFAAVNCFAAKQDVRYYLNGVHIEPHPTQGVVMVATNGHVLAVMHDPEGWIDPECESIIVATPSSRLLTACKKKGYTKETCHQEVSALWISENAGLVTWGDVKSEPAPFGLKTLASEKISIIDAKFPNWKRVLPEKKTALTSGVFPQAQSQYFDTCYEAAKIVFPRGRYITAPLDIQYESDEGKIIVRIGHEDLVERFVAIIMPVQVSSRPKQLLPAWLMPQQKQRIQFRGAEQVTTTGE